jgi:hypothetical protein
MRHTVFNDRSADCPPAQRLLISLIQSVPAGQAVKAVNVHADSCSVFLFRPGFRAHSMRRLG